MARRCLLWTLWLSTAQSLIIVEQTLHARHRPPSDQRHVETPARIDETVAALKEAHFAEQIVWKRARDSNISPEAAVTALKLVHSVDHLRGLVALSKTGGGFDTDTYCAPGSWEAMLDGLRAWMEAFESVGRGQGPAFALSRPAGHHATRSTAMGFGLVNFAAAAVASYLDKHPSAKIAILDWDVSFHARTCP